MRGKYHEGVPRLCDLYGHLSHACELVVRVRETSGVAVKAA